MKNIILLVATLLSVGLFSNSVLAQVPANTNAELQRLHDILRQNINSQDNGLRACAQSASGILNNLDWQARHKKDLGAWSVIYTTMNDYQTCVQNVNNRNAAQRLGGGQKDFLTKIKRVRPFLYHENPGVRVCAKTAIRDIEANAPYKYVDRGPENRLEAINTFERCISTFLP